MRSYNLSLQFKKGRAASAVLWLSWSSDAVGVICMGLVLWPRPVRTETPARAAAVENPAVEVVPKPGLLRSPRPSFMHQIPSLLGGFAGTCVAAIPPFDEGIVITAALPSAPIWDHHRSSS